MAEMARAGMRWLGLNIGEGIAWEEWRIVIERARTANVVPVPWARCRTLRECFDLLDMADLVAFQAILNIEDEFKDVVPPEKVAKLVGDFPELQVGISTVAWLYNDVDFSPLKEFPALLQIFPTDNGWEPWEIGQRQDQCVRHARDKGFTYVGATLQTYDGAKPSWYGYLNGSTRSLYTGDDVGAGNWEAWK